MKTLSYLFATVAATLSGPASSAIINIDSLVPAGTSATFAPGTYTVTFVGPPTAGAIYAGWNPFGSGSNCGTPSANCAGYTDRVAIGFGSNYTANFTQYETSSGNYYDTPEAALAAMQSAESAGTLVAYENDITATPVVGPIRFTLAAPTQVGFFVRDSYYGDNFGGVSLNVDAGTVPEPAVWALMVGGFCLVGGALRRRTATLAGA